MGYGFDNSWYAEVIARAKDYDPDALDDVPAAREAMRAESILVGCAMIAQAIDGLAKSIEAASKNVEFSIGCVADAVNGDDG